MSRGPGTIEQRIADLFAATRDRALSVADIVDNAYRLNGARPTRAQRLSATRAAHRLLKRVRQAHARAVHLVRQGHESVRSALGPQCDTSSPEYRTRLRADAAFIEGEKLLDYCQYIGMWVRLVRVEGQRGTLRGEDDLWCTITLKGRLYFHPPDVPVRVWAVSITPRGVLWVEAEVARVTDANVMVRYGGDTARLDRGRLWHWWAFWRGVRFVSNRTGRIAAELDAEWLKRYGGRAAVPPSMQMPFADAIRLLGVPLDYARDDVIAAFRRKVKSAHPDLGGTAEMFRLLVEARNRLLAALGTSARPPKPPNYAPKGVRVIYRVGSPASARLGSGTRRLLK